MNNLFGQATEVKKTTTKAKGNYEVVIVAESDYPSISEQLKQLQGIRDDIADKKALEEMLGGQVKAVAKEQFIRLYNMNGVNPKTYILKGELGGEFMIQTMDRYKGIDTGRAEALKAQYGDEVVTTDTQFIFNPNLLKKEGNMEKISKALMESDLTDEEKQNLIQTKVTQTVTKGTIDKLASHDIGRFMDDIQPVIALKNHAS